MRARHGSATKHWPSGRHVVITGASSGLGAALARAYSCDGATLTLTGRDYARLDAVARQCRELGAEVVNATCAVEDLDGMTELLGAADHRLPVDIVIANAGIGGTAVLAPPSGEPGHLAREIILVNTIGAMNSVTPLLAGFVARRRGHVVLISSVAALEGLADSPVYSASKAAIRTYGHGLRRLLYGSGVDVTVITAGFIATPMSASLPFPTPFVVDVDRAALRIKRAIERRTRELVFPWQFRWTVALSSLLPAGVVDVLLRMGRNWIKP